MATHRQHPRNTPKNERILRAELYKEISKQTGYTQKDIAAVIKSFHQVLVDKFTEGKTLFQAPPYFTMIVRKYPDRTYNYQGKTTIVPAHKKLVIVPGCALYDATGYENKNTREWRKRQKKGLKK